MQTISLLSFAYEPLPYDSELTAAPVVNGASLIELVAEYEQTHGYDLPGAYGGFCRSDFRGDPLEYYFLGVQAGASVSRRRWLVGCTCGVAGCWPLEATIVRNEQQVIWQDFFQPHRPRQDYSTFGPFFFDVDQYRQAVVELAQSAMMKI